MIPKALLTSKRQDYETPKPLFKYIEKFLDVVFVVDFAASDDNHLCPLYYTQKDSAFKNQWVVPAFAPNACGWCNPPYGDKSQPVGSWVAQALPDYNYVFLLPCNKMDQKWVWEVRDRAAWVKIIGRVQFTIDGKRQAGGNSQGSTLLCMGPHFKPGETKYLKLKDIS